MGKDKVKDVLIYRGVPVGHVVFNCEDGRVKRITFALLLFDYSFQK